MKIIDFHTHVYPDSIAERGSKSISDFYGIPHSCIGSVNVLAERSGAAGISRSLLLPVALKAENVRHINDFTAQAAKSRAEFCGFGTIHADMHDMLGEAERICGLGLKGIKLHPDIQGFPVDDKRLYPLYDAVAGHMPVLVHCGDPRYDHSRPERLRRVLDDFPKLQVVGAHLGGWSMFEKAFEYLHDTDCCFDISSCIMFLGMKETARYIDRYGADRILFGTDFPLWDPVTEVERFMSLKLSSGETEKIAYKNAERFLGSE